MQPNNIYVPESAYEPEQMNLYNMIEKIANQEYPLESMSYEYMIHSDSDDESILEDNNLDRPNANRNIILQRNMDQSLNIDDLTKDICSQNADLLMKYVTILLKDAAQKERAIKRLQAEFDQKTKEIADLKDIYEKLKRKR